MRKDFGRYMAELAEKDKDVILIVGDIGYGTFDEFINKFPDRFINMGICEQSMIGVAAGMALMDLKPYVFTITPFLIERPFEAIKVDIDLNKAKVVLVGYADYPRLGPTHNIIDDASYMRVFKNINSYYPETVEDARNAYDEAYKSELPSFIRLKLAKK